MINKIDIKKLERFSKGVSNVEDEKYVYSLFSEQEGSLEFKQHLVNEFDKYLKNNPEEDHNLSHLLDRIHHTINNNENRKKSTIVRRIYKWYAAAAALLLIPVLIAGGIWNLSKNQEDKVTSTLFAPIGSRISFSLPDGTTGWLNSESSIAYEIPFSHNRQVAVSGEAWFDVFHDTEHPFEISAGGSKVKVLGTKFNLSSYPDDKYVEVVLEEGKVEFLVPGKSAPIEMKPNERLIFQDGSINIEKTDAAKYGAWKEGKLVFRGDPMIEVARRVERWYNVEVELADKDLENYTIRGTFQDDSLEEVIRYLCMTSPITCRILDRKMLANGTWQKQKIIFYKK